MQQDAAHGLGMLGQESDQPCRMAIARRVGHLDLNADDPAAVLDYEIHLIFWVLAQPTEEDWQALRQETASLQDLINGAIWGSALIEGWAIDQYAELADEAAAGEYIERLGARYPFIADALVMRQLQEFQLLATEALGIGDEPAGPASLSTPAANAGEGLAPQDGAIGEWVKRQVGDPWSFLKGFLLQVNEDGTPWSNAEMAYERGTFLVAEAEGLSEGLTFGLYKSRLGYWNYYHINGEEKGLIAIGHTSGNFLSIPLGAKLPGEMSRGGVNLVRKAAAGLKPGGDRYWSIFKLTVEGDVKEPARLGLSVIHKGDDDWVSKMVGRDYNLIHWGDNPSFGGSHWAIGWTRKAVEAADGGLLYGARNEVAFGAGVHIYTGCISGWGRVVDLGPDFVEASAEDGRSHWDERLCAVAAPAHTWATQACLVLFGAAFDHA